MSCQKAQKMKSLCCQCFFERMKEKEEQPIDV